MVTYAIFRNIFDNITFPESLSFKNGINLLELLTAIQFFAKMQFVSFEMLLFQIKLMNPEYWKRWLLYNWLT